ncbi:MAG: DUF1512 domain-containing protein [Nitrososphaerota archaeon]|nr:DUF1512 domain-containing protein [Candidatus Bathyarchaeota archaeon]MDW8061938.1 DUF1512 domain-containing protein [Nitrososphaerota archaeon]
MQSISPILVEVGVGGEGDNLSTIFQMIFLIFFIVMMTYGQKIQAWIMLKNISLSVEKLRRMRDEARMHAIKHLKEYSDRDDVEVILDRMLQYFWIQPTSLDPTGIVGKIEHILNLRDERIREEVMGIASKAGPMQVSNIENIVEIGISMDQIYRVVRHFYEFGKKTKSLFIVYQLEAQLPFILQEAEALMGALTAFENCQPIGDGAGALVAARFMYGTKSEKVAKDTVYADIIFEGRTISVVKAEGPGGNVGKPDQAIARLIEEYGRKPSIIVMVDAALKLEGEETGEVAEGVGAAIGGIGVEKFRIEEVAKKYGIPLYAVVIKQSLREAVSPMSRRIYDGVYEAIERVKRIIRERIPAGGYGILVGVGNTVGIGQ